MANKTIDRKKANLARSRANQANPKPKAARPAVGKEEASSVRLDQASRNATGTEVLEVEELDVEEAAVTDEIEGPEDDSAEPDDEDEDTTPRARRAKKRERGLTPAGGQSYAISQTTAVRAPSNPFVRFVLSAYRELRLVTWPSRRDTWNWSLVVIAVCAGIGILLGAIDLGLVNFVNWWLSLAQK